jgi:hypothetical protein
VCHWVAEKSWKARKTCAQEKVFHERKTRCFLPLSFVQINSIQPLLYVLSAIIVPLLFIYILIFLAFLLQYGDYLYASHFHFIVVVIWVCLKSCFPSVRPGINEFGVLVGLFKTWGCLFIDLFFFLKFHIVLVDYELNWFFFWFKNLTFFLGFMQIRFNSCGLSVFFSGPI